MTTMGKKYVIEIMEYLSDHGRTEFLKIFNDLKMEFSKAYLSKLLLEMNEKYLVERKEEREGKKTPKPYYKLTPIGKKLLKQYRLEKKAMDLYKIVDKKLSEKYERISTELTVNVEYAHRAKDLTPHFQDYFQDQLFLSTNGAESKPAIEGEEFNNAIPYVLEPDLAYQYRGKGENLYVFFENHEVYDYGNSIYNEIKEGVVVLVRNIYDKMYVFFNTPNINEIFNEINAEVEEEFVEKSPVVYFEETEACKKLNEEKWLRKKELFEKHYKRAVVKTPEEIAEKIIQYIENLK